MTATRVSTIRRAFPPAIALIIVLFTVLSASRRAESAVLPLGDEQDSWSDMLFPSATGAFKAVSRTLTIGNGPVHVPADLEIGSQFGPSNPGSQYGTGGTMGGAFNASFGVTRLHVSASGAVTNQNSIITVSYQGGPAGSLGTDLGINTGRTLFGGIATEVLLDAAGDDTLDILFSITSGDLQVIRQPPLGIFAPDKVGLIRITAPNLPSTWTSNFNFTATTVHFFGLVPEPGTCLLACLVALFMSLARSPRQCPWN